MALMQARGDHGGIADDAGGSADPAAGRPQRLALIGLRPDTAEPLRLVAEILGWQVDGWRAEGWGAGEWGAGAGRGAPAALAWPAVPRHVRLCLAPLPATAGDAADVLPPLVAWSPDSILNEHISREGLSIMEQPPCINRVELLLQTASRSFARTN
jgi:hypothetical protein